MLAGKIKYGLWYLQETEHQQEQQEKINADPELYHPGVIHFLAFQYYPPINGYYELPALEQLLEENICDGTPDDYAFALLRELDFRGSEMDTGPGIGSEDISDTKKAVHLLSECCSWREA